MFDYLKGIISEKKENYLVLEVNGIGYRIFYSSLDDFPEIGEEGKIYIYEHIREDGWDLYGFSSTLRRSFFEKLLSIPKIGPKMAMGILSSYPLDELSNYIKNENVAMLNKISGVGKKTAERIVLELKDKLGDLILEMGVEIAPSPQKEKESLDTQLWKDVEEALLNLGFSRNKVKKKIEDYLKSQYQEDQTLDQIISSILASFYEGN